jgi:hypothetical protein
MEDIRQINFYPALNTKDSITVISNIEVLDPSFPACGRQAQGKKRDIIEQLIFHRLELPTGLRETRRPTT